MIMEIPEKIRIPYVKVEDGVLVIHKLVRFEDLMYELTYSCKKIKCIYCGKKMKKSISTLDHRYPRDTGGISIVDNLFPCCADCNSKKGNLTHEEYLKMRKLTPKEKKKYREELKKYRKQIFLKKGFKLPKKWVTYENIKSINYCVPQYILRGRRYHRIVEFYDKYKHLPRPIIVDKNNKLLDGYNLILFAQDFNIAMIPVVKLENVLLNDTNE